jgi:hypothetical protein
VNLCLVQPSSPQKAYSFDSESVASSEKAADFAIFEHHLLNFYNRVLACSLVSFAGGLFTVWFGMSHSRLMIHEAFADFDSFDVEFFQRKLQIHSFPSSSRVYSFL